jgi:Carboxypeptidase regulatory-like domain/TonB-dependent Receptor Plug Domain
MPRPSARTMFRPSLCTKPTIGKPSEASLFDCLHHSSQQSTTNLCALILLSAALLISSPISVSPQSATATLSGTVVDQNGAVVPGVNVAVINLGQGFQRSATTQSEGNFVVALLPPGTYIVKAEREGFAPAEVRDVVLNVNDQLTLQIQLKVGTIAGEIVIVNNRSLIDDSPTVQSTIDQRLVNNLPVNGRTIQAMIALTPGVVLTKANGTEGGQFSINGQRANANYVTLDGTSANVGISPGFGLGQSAAGSLPAFSSSGGTNSLVSIDALEEFKVLTSTYAPEFGRTPGGQIQMVTRSGTKDFHGNLFEYLRNDALDANDWFVNANRLTNPALRQNDFGGVIGGPIVLPRFGEGNSGHWYNTLENSFFFFSYEGLRLRIPQPAITSVPSLTTRQTATAEIQPYLNAFPLPNGPILSNGAAQFASSFSNPSNIDATSIRLDHARETVNIFGRYNYSPSETVTRGGNFSLNTINPAKITTETLTAGVTWIPSAGIGNDFRLNWSKLKAASWFIADIFGGAVVPADSSLFPESTSRNDAIFIFNYGGGSAGLQWDVGSNSDNSQKQWNFVDNLSFATGTHQLKFGIDYRRLVPTFGPRAYAQIVSFDDVASTLNARASSAIVGAAAGGSLLFKNFSSYAQDTWRVSQRLTFTYGVRWEVNPPPSETNGNDPFAITETPGDFSSIALAARNTPLYETDFGAFAPRLGFAWQLVPDQGRETIVRGGFGVFYDLATGPAGDLLIGFPYLANKVLINAPFPLSQSAATPPSLITNPISTFSSFDPTLKLPYTYQFNLALQQSLGANQTVSATYVGAIGRRLLRKDRLLTPNPAFVIVTIARNGATSDYHSLQLQYNRRLSRGLQAIASYNWSHSIDNASNDSAVWVPEQRLDPRNERGASDFDVRHAFSAALSYDIFSESQSRKNFLLRDWSVDGIYSARSATPVNVITGTTIFGVSSALRPDLLLGVPLYLDDPLVGGGRRINRAAFVTPAAGRQGSLGRNALRGFPMWQMDLALRRQFNLSERVNLQFRAELFNIFNHPNFGDPGARSTLTNALNSPLFGQSTLMLNRSLGTGGLQPGLNPLYQVGGPRSIQFALKLKF